MMNQAYRPFDGLSVILLTTSCFLGTTLGQTFYPSPPLAPVADAPGSVDPAGSESEASPMAQPKPKPDGRITLELKDGSRLVGRPRQLRDVRFKVAFGEIHVPWKLLAGIRFPSVDEPVAGSPDTSTILFNNGDVLQGEVLLDEIQLESVWGRTTVATEHLQAIINSAQPHVWSWSDRWRLHRSNEFPDKGVPGPYQPRGVRPQSVPSSPSPAAVPAYPTSLPADLAPDVESTLKYDGAR